MKSITRMDIPAATINISRVKEGWPEAHYIYRKIAVFYELLSVRDGDQEMPGYKYLNLRILLIF